MATTTVTVMFTDLVDSTALMSRVGEVAAEGLRREHFSILRGAIDQRSGREVKNLGDGLMIVFPSAADAVAAAVDIQRASERRNRRAAEPLVVRVGVALGDTDVDEDDFFGVPVVQASRLCARAGGGEILCTDLVRMLAGARVDASFEAIGELELKGLAEPVPTCRVTWRADDEPVASALPARLAAAVTHRFVGRAAERERLATSWKRASAERQCRVALLSGEPGIGKTTLTAQLAAGVQAEGAVVVYGRCDEDLGIPYQPWIEALGQLIAAAGDDVLQAHVADRGAHLARLVPTLARRTGVSVPAIDGGDSERFVVLGCVVDLLERVSADSPVVVVIDDLHWADRQSVQVLKHIATSALDGSVLIVGTFRDTDVADGDPMSDLLAALHRVDTVDRLALRGLDDSDLLEFLERTAGHEMDDAGVALRDAVLAETSGNPFFVNEILRHLVETGAIFQDDDGRWVGDRDIRSAGLPVSVTEVIGRRVAGLGAETQQLLTLAAVIGRDFDVTTLSVAAGVDELDVIDRCDDAVAAAVLQPTGVVDRYTFTHALIERTLYSSMSDSRRARAHRTVAETIESLHGDDPARSGELAHHWSAAVRPADTSKAIRYAQLAGDRALDQLAPHDALQWYARALDFTDAGNLDARQRVEILIGLGAAQRLAGHAEHRQTLLDAARDADRIGATDLYIRAVIASSRGWLSNTGNTDHERITNIERALVLVGAQDTPERARLLVSAALEQLHTIDLDERVGLVDEAAAIARRLDDSELLLWVIARGGNAVRHPRTTVTRQAWASEASALVTDSTPLDVRADVLSHSVYIGLDLGDAPTFTGSLDASRPLVGWISESSRTWSTLFMSAVEPLLRGDLVDAERLAESALEFGLAGGQPDAFTIYGAQVVNLRLFQGRMHELLPMMEEAFRAAPELHAYRAAIALAHAQGADEHQARRLIESEAAIGFDLPHDEQWSFTLATWARVACRLSHRRTAGLLHPLLAPYADRFAHSQIVVSGAVAMHLGQLEHVLGRFDDADRSFAQAEQMHQRLDSPMLTADGNAHWAAMLVDRDAAGDHDRARSLATAALEVAVAGGFGYTESLARQVLARLDRESTDGPA